MAASIGIIGGADGPTAIFLTGGNWLAWPAAGVVLMGIYLWYRRKKR